MIKQVDMERIRIEIKGCMDKEWLDWFDGVEINYKENTTILICENKDQAYIHGILNKIRDLNLKLISVNPYKEIK